MYDVIIIGVGCVGSSTTHKLSKTDLNILSIDQFNVPNEKGSSHGSSRIMRLAYHEGGKYVPLLYDALDDWSKLEEKSDKDLFFQTGSLALGSENTNKFELSKNTCDEFDIPYKMYDNKELKNLYPAWDLPNKFHGMYQPQGGLLDNEECIKTQVKLAQENGAKINTYEKVLNWHKNKEGNFNVKTNKTNYNTKKLVITSGPWAKKHVNKLDELLSVERHVAGQFNMRDNKLFKKSNFPVWIFDTGSRKYYGLPSHKGKYTKVGETTEKEIISDMSNFNRDVSKKEINSLTKFYDEYTCSSVNEVDHISPCPLTNTPDSDFIIDEIEPDVFAGVGLSGHGFKLSNIIGKILCNLVQDNNVEYNIEPFSINRFN